jgi:hypothetical protein
MQVRVERRHVARHEAPVLVHRVSRERGHALGDDRLQELDHAGLGLGFGEARFADLVDEPRFSVRGLVPRVHGVEDFVRLVDYVHGSLGDRVQFRVGDDHRDFEDAVALGNEARHLHVYPDQRGFVGSRHAPIVSQQAP